MLTTASPLPTERREFEQHIRENIDAQTGRRLLNIDVKLVGNRVVVKGEALSYYIKQLALASVLKTVRTWTHLQVVHDIRVNITPNPEKDPLSFPSSAWEREVGWAKGHYS